jgi:hypothetical protein
MIGSVRLPELADGRDQVLWPRLLDLAEALPQPHVFVGGLMVCLHASVAGRKAPAVSRAIDVVVDLRAKPVDLAAVLHELGYESDEEIANLYGRGDGIPVTVRALERIKPHTSFVSPPAPMITVPGGTTVLTDPVSVLASYGPRTAPLWIPDIGRALFTTSRAYLVDRDANRLPDIAFLVSLIGDPDKVLDELGASRSADRFEFLAALDDPVHPAWLDLGTYAEPAHRTWTRLRHN